MLNVLKQVLSSVALCRVCVVLGTRNMNANIPSIDKERLLAHLDHSNPSTFEVEDLSRLIKQVCITSLLTEFLIRIVDRVALSYSVSSFQPFMVVQKKIAQSLEHRNLATVKSGVMHLSSKSTEFTWQQKKQDNTHS